MEPTALKPDLKEEPEFGMGKVSVSWHADSSLEHESTIAVSSPPDSLAVGSSRVPSSLKSYGISISLSNIRSECGRV